MEDDLIFLQCGDVTVPFLWEESRLDLIQRRRAEISTHYNRVIGEYERELEKIHDELRRSPHCSNLLHTELIYRQRLTDVRAKLASQLQELDGEEADHRERLKEIEREKHRPTPVNRYGYMMYGYGSA